MSRQLRVDSATPNSLLEQRLTAFSASSAVALAAALAAATFAWALLRHRLLLYGDATAHVMIARRMVDSATPGLSQWGTGWLPLPHLLAATLILMPGFWRTGAAGAIVSIIGYVLSVWWLHALTRRHFGGAAAGWAALVCLLNPNLVYLSAVPMTESVYLAAFIGCVDQISRFTAGAHQRFPLRHALAAGGFALAATLTRYDGWFILPFCAVALLAGGRKPFVRRLAAPLLFILVAAIGPLFWFRYNQYFFGDWLAFARGPYSARQIYLNALHHGGHPYPGDHNLWLALVYYLGTVRVDAGYPLLLLGEVGFVAYCAARWRALRTAARAAAATPASEAPADRSTLWWLNGSLDTSPWPVLLLWLPLPWYIWAMWSGNVPIFIPQFWPHGYYNVRYGVQLLPALAAFSGLLIALVVRAPATRRAAAWRRLAVPVAACAVLTGYLLMFRGLGPVAYGEAVYNSPARLAMEAKLASALRGYRRGDGLLMFLGTYPGALAEDGISLREVIQEGNYRLWDRALQRPQDSVRWVVLETNTGMARDINRVALARDYVQVAEFTAPLQNVVRVYRRSY